MRNYLSLQSSLSDRFPAPPKSVFFDIHISDAQSQLRIGSGLVLANPIPHEHSFALREMEEVISQALSDAEEAGSTGSRNTPFVLNRIRELTGGRSVISNRGLVESNVARATRVAVELSRLNTRKVVSRGSAMNR